MTVRAKWVQYVPSGVAPQEIEFSLLSRQLMSGQEFFVYQIKEIAAMVILTKRWQRW